MRRIIDVDDVQRKLDRAAHDAKHGTADVRAGRFVHREATAGKVTTGDRSPTRSAEGGRKREVTRA